MKTLKGLGTALITPFQEDGSVDYEALGNLLNLQIEGEVNYIVVLGTTGEAATLTEAERQRVRVFVRDYVACRVPLVLGVGGNCTASVCDMLQTIDFTGYSAILSVCPYYNKPSQEGLYQHFVTLAKTSPLPIILYNVPGRAGVNMLPETVMRIYHACPDQILGIKEASGNVPQIKLLIEMAKGSSLLVISGDDGIAAEIMEAGGAGLISVASNVWPKEFGELVHHAYKSIQAHFAQMISLLFKEGNPSGIKTVLHQKGLIHNILRLPLVPNSEIVQAEIADALKTI